MPAGGKPKLAILEPWDEPGEYWISRKFTCGRSNLIRQPKWRSDVTIIRSIVFIAAPMAPQVLDAWFRLGRALAG